MSEKSLKDIQPYDIVKKITTILLLSYAAGFIVLNFHLSGYGFFEYNLLQTKYVSAGLLSLSPFIILYLIFGNLIQKIKIKKEFSLICVKIIFLFFLLIYLFSFSEYFFYKIPSYFGGGKSIPISIISDPETIKYLSNFNIGMEENSNEKSVQTKPLCNIYQNQDYILVGVSDEEFKRRRVLVLKQDKISGLSIVPITECDYIVYCSGFEEWNNTHKKNSIFNKIINFLKNIWESFF